MAFDPFSDDDELARLDYQREVDELVDADVTDAPESSRRLAPGPWMDNPATRFERHFAEPAP